MRHGRCPCRAAGAAGFGEVGGFPLGFLPAATRDGPDAGSGFILALQIFVPLWHFATNASAGGIRVLSRGVANFSFRYHVVRTQRREGQYLAVQPGLKPFGVSLGSGVARGIILSLEAREFIPIEPRPACPQAVEKFEVAACEYRHDNAR